MCHHLVTNIDLIYAPLVDLKLYHQQLNSFSTISLCMGSSRTWFSVIVIYVSVMLQLAVFLPFINFRLLAILFVA